MHRTDISKLEVGDIIYENAYGESEEVEITSKPVKTYSESLQANQWTFTGKTGRSNGDFLITEGQEHYGPNLTDEPEY